MSRRYVTFCHSFRLLTLSECFTPTAIDVSDGDDTVTPSILSHEDSTGETCLQRIDDRYRLGRCEEETVMKFISCESGMERVTYKNTYCNTSTG